MRLRLSKGNLSLFFLVLLVVSLFVGGVLSSDSSDLDEVCSLNNASLQRINGSWGCAFNISGGVSDGNNYPKNITISGTDTKTINITRNGLEDMIATFTDLQGSGGISNICITFSGNQICSTAFVFMKLENETRHLHRPS